MAIEEQVAVPESLEYSPTPQVPKLNSWSAGEQHFVLHKVCIQAHGSASTIECAMLLDSTMIPLLPTKPITPIPPPDQTFVISSAGDKGAGMFAARDIPAGALILVEHPVIITPAVFPLPQNSGAYEALFDHLQPLARQELLTMTNCRPLSECSSQEEGISRTNGTGIDLPVPLAMANDLPAQEYGAVFLKINRSNHSCGPNAAQKWDLASFSLSLYSLRPILAGEEITMIYTDATASRETRRTKLHRLYGFDCTCPYCDLADDDAIAQSDLARAELRDWRHTNPGFLKWSTDLCRADDTVIKSHQRALDLIEQEGMHGLQCTYLDGIARSYAMLGDEEQFKIWGQRVIDVCIVQDPEQAADYMRWVANPRTLKKWGWRKAQRLQASGGRRTPGNGQRPARKLGLPRVST